MSSGRSTNGRFEENKEDFSFRNPFEILSSFHSPTYFNYCAESCFFVVNTRQIGWGNFNSIEHLLFSVNLIDDLTDHLPSFVILNRFCNLPPTSYIIHHFSGAPRGAFQQPAYNKCKVRWLRVSARPLQAVHNAFLSETLSCALSQQSTTPALASTYRQVCGIF